MVLSVQDQKITKTASVRIVGNLFNYPRFMGICSTSFVATWTVLILHWFTFLMVGHVKGGVHNKALKKNLI